MEDYREIYNQAAEMFAKRLAHTPSPELLFIDRFTDLQQISDVLRRNQVAMSQIDLAHFEGPAAEALMGETGEVFVLRKDAKGSPSERIHRILHELARIHLHSRTSAEFEPGDTFIVTGYHIWEEFAAEVLARAIDAEGVPPMLYEMELGEILKGTEPGDLAQYAAEVATSYEGRMAKEWTRLEQEMQALNLPQQNIVKILFERMKFGDWDADEPWLGRLGAAFYIESGLK